MVVQWFKFGRHLVRLEGDMSDIDTALRNVGEGDTIESIEYLAEKNGVGVELHP